MTYLAILALVVVAALLYQSRGIIGVILADAKLRAGDYDAALRRLHGAALGSPNAALLHKQGLILTAAGRPAEAEIAYRKALGSLDAASAYPRGRLLAALGHALIDLARYADAETCFQQAIEQSLSLPATASLHWRAAMAYQAMQQTEEARKHFETARTLDPHGKYGQQA